MYLNRKKRPLWGDFVALIRPVPAGRLLIASMPEREGEIPSIQADYPGEPLSEVRATDGSLLYTYNEYRPAA